MASFISSTQRIALLLRMSCCGLLVIVISNVVHAQQTLEEQLNARIDELYENGDYKACVPLYQQLQTIYIAEKRWEDQMQAYVYAGHCLQLAGQYTQTSNYLDTALQVAQQRNIARDSEVFGIYYSYAGDYYNQLGDLEKAYQINSQLLLADKKAYEKDSLNFPAPHLAADYNNIGIYFKRKGDYAQARDYYLQALLFYADDQIADRTTVYNNLAETYEEEGNTQVALVFHHRALYLAQTAKDKQGLLLLYNNLAGTYINTQPDSAYYYLSLLKPLLSATHLADQATYHQLLAELKENEGNFESAERNMQLALQLRKTVFGTKNAATAFTYRYLGEMYAKQNQHQKALATYQLALVSIANDFDEITDVVANPSIENGISNRLELLSILKRKAQSFHALQQTKNARNTLHLAIQLIDQIRFNYLADGSKYTLLERAMPIYEQAIDLAVERGEIERAFEIAERSKATILLESIRNQTAQTFAGIPETTLAKERDLKVQIAFYERLWNEAEDEVMKANHQQKLFDLRQAYQDFLAQLERDYPKYYELKYQSSKLNINSLQQEIVDEETALLEYFIGDNSIYLFALTTDGLTVQKWQKTNEFEAQLQALRQALNEPSTDRFADFTSSAFFVYNNYLAKALDHLPKTIHQLIFIPDGSLSYIPFQALIQHPIQEATIADPRFDTLSYLVYDYSISYAYSSTLLLNNQSRKASSSLAFGGFAPVFEGGADIPERSSRKQLSALPFSQLELEQISELWKGESYLTTTASLANFKEKAANFNILHLSTHAAVEDDPTQSRIYFYDDYLTVSEIYNLPIRADLTVLSACETGVGEYQKGEGMLSLARAFRYAGCPSLVTSLWQVNDEKTADLMLNFYRQLKAKQSKPIALQQAQIDYLETASMQSAHPFYWAAFVQVGERSSLLRRSSNWLRSIGLLLPILLLIIVKAKSKPARDL
jgi:CHAT domain-containing protein